VDALPAEERVVLMLVCAGGMSYQDTARKLGISKDEVMSRLLGGRLALMRRMPARPASGPGSGSGGEPEQDNASSLGHGFDGGCLHGS
jgi:hypothetical protein